MRSGVGWRCIDSLSPPPAALRAATSPLQGEVKTPHRHMRRNLAPISTGVRAAALGAAAGRAGGQARLAKCWRIAAGMKRVTVAYMCRSAFWRCCWT